MKTNTKADVKTEKSQAAGTGVDVPTAQFEIVPRSKVRPDPNQPRRDFNEDALEELAWSIYRQGILQPLIVRLVPGLKVKEPDMIEKEWQAVNGAGAVVFKGSEAAVNKFAEGKTEAFYQIIAGERRFRASGPREFKPEPGRNEETVKWPGLSALPVMVREATEREIFAMQHIENLQRVNLSALEDAQSFARELEKRKQADPEMTPEKLGAELGLKRGTIYNRLKLLRLHEPVRQMLTAGKIDVSVAIEIASVPELKKQEEILEEIEDRREYGDDMSFREVKEMVDEEYAKPLKGAPFDTEDANLVSPQWKIVIGKNEITVECVKRPQFPNLRTIGVPKLIAGMSSRPEEYGKVFVTDRDGLEMVGPIPVRQAKELVKILLANTDALATVTRMGGGDCPGCPHRSGVMDPESKTPNVCTLTACFDQKVKTHWIRKMDALKANGAEVLTEKDLRKRGKHISADRHEYTQNRSGTWQELMGKHAPDPVMVATKEGIKKFYPLEEAKAAAKKNGVKFYTSGTPQTKEEIEKEEAAEKKREKLKEQRNRLVGELRPALFKAIAVLDDKACWAILASQEIRKWDFDNAALKELVHAAKTPRANVIGRVFAHEGHRPVGYDGEWDKNTVALYKAAGIDLLAEEKKLPPEKEPALPLKKPEAKQKDLLTVPKSKAPKEKKRGGVKPKTKKRK